MGRRQGLLTPPLGAACCLRALLASAVAAAAPACTTNPVGVSECQEIEQERCRAVIHCDEPRIRTQVDVAACERFARDNCLHGLPVEEPPRSAQLRACVTAIRAAGECARQSGAEAPAADCEGARARREAETACDVVHAPDHSSACDFLVPDDPAPPEPDAGGGSSDAESEPDN